MLVIDQKTLQVHLKELEFSPWVRIIIVAYNSGNVLQKCIDHLVLQTERNYEVVIVDNQSTDNCVTNLHLPDDRFSVLRSERNLGFAAGSNWGAKNARTDWLITLNPDVFVTSTWLQMLKNAALSNPSFAMLSPVLVREEDNNILDGCGDVLSIFGICWRGGSGLSRENAPKGNCRVMSPCGASAAYKRDVFETHGGFDPSFFCYMEDVDLALRLNKAGEKCLLASDSIAYHIGSSTLGEGHPFIAYLSTRNSITMIVKTYPVLNALCALPSYIALRIWNICRNPKQKSNLSVIKGIIVGLLLAPYSACKRIWNKFMKRRWKTVFFTPMQTRLSALKNCEIWAWKLKPDNIDPSQNTQYEKYNV